MINTWVYITNFNQFIPHTKRGLIVTMIYLLSFNDFFPTKKKKSQKNWEISEIFCFSSVKLNNFTNF
jgi:hypothetical protein